MTGDTPAAALPPDALAALAAASDMLRYGCVAVPVSERRRVGEALAQLLATLAPEYPIPPPQEPPG